MYYQVPFLVNFLYQIPTRSRFHPFIGGRIGGVGTVLEDYDLFYGTSDDSFGWGWHGTAGVFDADARALNRQTAGARKRSSEGVNRK